MNRQVRVGQQSKRVADYFAVVGLKYLDYDDTEAFKALNGDDGIDLLSFSSESDKFLLNESKSSTSSRRHSSSTCVAYDDHCDPEVIDRYPLKDYDDFSFPEGIPLFCFPNGLQIESQPQTSVFYSFVSTSEDGARLLGSCLRFYELVPDNMHCIIERYLQQQGKTIAENPSQKYYIPKCLCLISRWPFSLGFKKVLCGFYRVFKASSKSKLKSPHPMIPLERYICNFIDDVPAPPWGRLDVIYYIGEDSVSFRCPPYNEPNAWSSFPLYPLFECLDPDNILILFNLLLTERQIVFISSQYSLLTSCLEAVTSLMYPITWAHAYIPILPIQLLGVLGAPFPYILGIHASFLQHKDCVFSYDSARIYLDKNRIELGEDFTPLPELPERRAKKLMHVIMEHAAVFEHRTEGWSSNRLQYYDHAFSPVAAHPPRGSNGSLLMNESKIREGFLKFFVAILMNYRRFLIYNASTTQPLQQFRANEFLAEQPATWQPFLKEMISTQSFSTFLDERVSNSMGGRDVIFFDESIDAKLNRYTFRIHNIDTPFLLNNAHKHTKTYVAPSPDTSNLPSSSLDLLSSSPSSAIYDIDDNFPRLRSQLFSPPRRVKIPFDPSSALNVGWNTDRLKRMASIAVAPTLQENNAADDTAGTGRYLTQASCMFSVFLALISHTIMLMGSKRSKHPQIAAIGVLTSTIRLLDEFGTSTSNSNATTGDETSSPDRMRRKTSFDASALHLSPATAGFALNWEDDETANARAAAMELGLKVAFESMNCLTRLDHAPGEIAYRSLLDACGMCGDFIKAVDVLVYMNCEGLLPDRFILNAVARAFATDNMITPYRNQSKRIPSLSKAITTNDIFKTEDWRPLRLQPEPHPTSSTTASTSTTSPAHADDHAKKPPPQKLSVQYRASAPFLLFSPSSRNSTIVNILFGKESDSGKKKVAGSSPTFTSPAIDIATRSSSSPATPQPSQPPPVPPKPSTSSSYLSDAMALAGEAIEATLSYDTINFPSLQWMNFHDPHRLPIYAASKKLHRHMRHSERLLIDLYPDLAINLQHPQGLGCNNKRCNLGRPLTVQEVYRGWKTGDANTYTTRCFHCNATFVPRFTVTTSNMGGELDHELWCELLSPWTLRKEVYSALFQDGIADMLAPSYRSASSQRAVLFWNLIVVFRLIGVPYAFLLSEGVYHTAFPLPSISVPANGATCKSTVTLTRSTSS